jgi:hypothetical protein
MMAASASNYYYPPTIYLSEKDFPGIENWKAGDKVNLAVTATVSSINTSEREKGKKSFDASLKLTAIADLGGKA